MVRSPKNQSLVSSVGELISDNDSSLSNLVSRARQLLQVQSLLAGHTGPELAMQFQVAAMRQDRLVLITPTASLATRLRMQANQYLHFLQMSGYPHLRYIDIRIAPLNRETNKAPVRRHLSPAAEFALRLMDSMSGDPDNDPKN